MGCETWWFSDQILCAFLAGRAEVCAPGAHTRGLGLPAFIARETVSGNKGSLNFSSAKSQPELGWTYLPAREIWSSILDEERKLLSARKKQDLVSRLEPVEVSG